MYLLFLLWLYRLSSSLRLGTNMGLWTELQLLPSSGVSVAIEVVPSGMYSSFEPITITNCDSIYIHQLPTPRLRIGPLLLSKLRT
jgi:hypothetical protein